MKLQKTFYFLMFLCIAFAQNANSSSLDSIYRDIIRSNNSGYLPLFVKNRQTPNFTLSEEDIDNLPKQQNIKNDPSAETIKLTSNYNQLDALTKARHQQWLKTIAAIKSNQVTPFELDEITTRVSENDPKATEILAWMYAKGVGVKTDFITSFNLYKKAALLNVENAERNALIVYKSMNESQRRKIKNNM
jgi:TPR repeat protein